jgi:hypothetical protein
MNKSDRGTASRALSAQEKFYHILNAVLSFTENETKASRTELLNWLLGYIFMEVAGETKMTMEDIDFFVPMYFDNRKIPKKLREDYIKKINPRILLRERTADNRKELKNRKPVKRGCKK